MPYYINERAKESKAFTIAILGTSTTVTHIKTKAEISFDINTWCHLGVILPDNEKYLLDYKIIDKAREFARKNIIIK